jgi:hypothetical protein
MRGRHVGQHTATLVLVISVGAFLQGLESRLAKDMLRDSASAYSERNNPILDQSSGSGSARAVLTFYHHRLVALGLGQEQALLQQGLAQSVTLDARHHAGQIGGHTNTEIRDP